MTWDRRCVNCGQFMSGERRADAETCSDACRREMWRKRKAAEVADDVREMVYRKLKETL